MPKWNFEGVLSTEGLRAAARRRPAGRLYPDARERSVKRLLRPSLKPGISPESRFRWTGFYDAIVERRFAGDGPRTSREPPGTDPAGGLAVKRPCLRCGALTDGSYRPEHRPRRPARTRQLPTAGTGVRRVRSALRRLRPRARAVGGPPRQRRPDRQQDPEHDPAVRRLPPIGDVPRASEGMRRTQPRLLPAGPAASAVLAQRATFALRNPRSR